MQSSQQNARRKGGRGCGKYLDEINSIYYTVEIPESDDEKPEDKKNREKRRDTRIKFVAACKKFNELLIRTRPLSS